MKIRVRIEPEMMMGLWACEVGSASADFTPQNENLPKPAAARAWLVEVGTETADFNVLLLPKPKLDDVVLGVSTLSSLKYK